jgi:hypothetical protein
MPSGASALPACKSRGDQAADYQAEDEIWLALIRFKMNQKPEAAEHWARAKSARAALRKQSAETEFRDGEWRRNAHLSDRASQAQTKALHEEAAQLLDGDGK